MGYIMSKDGFNQSIEELKKDYRIYAPVLKEGEGTFSNTDIVRYDQIKSAEEIVLDRKSDYSFKDILLPLSQTLFFFTEDQVKEADENQKKILIFLRSCDIHAVKRLDEIYLNNGCEDYYYSRIREKISFALIGCAQSFENCFCVDMGANKTDDYGFSVDQRDGNVRVNVRDASFRDFFQKNTDSEVEVIPNIVEKNEISVDVPKIITLDLVRSDVWDEYSLRCINCGRCNFVCPTCTCFTMQDIYYTDNCKVGERRRVAASCMVDGFTEVAGGGAYRKTNGERMRFKVMHKVYDYKQRFGYHMCVGCGRCDGICPEYISFSSCINKIGGEKQ